jgi:hypothetical protein
MPEKNEDKFSFYKDDGPMSSEKLGISPFGSKK